MGQLLQLSLDAKLKPVISAETASFRVVSFPLYHIQQVFLCFREFKEKKESFKMTVEAETVVENVQTLDITKVEEPFKTDKEVIAEEVTEEKKEVKEKKKPVVNKKDFEEDVVYLFQFNRSSQIPSISPLCLQVESWLKLHGIKFENVDLKSKLWSKEGKMLPFIELNGEKIVETNNIFETLATKFEKEIDSHLDEDQKKTLEELTEVVEKHLYWAIVQWRSVDHENMLKGYKMVVPTTLGAQLPPAAVKVYFNYTYCRKGLKLIKASEVGTNTQEEIEQFGKDDLKKLSEKLGEQKFFFGDEMSSFLSGLAPAPTNIREHRQKIKVRKRDQSVVAHRGRRERDS